MYEITNRLAPPYLVNILSSFQLSDSHCTRGQTHGNFKVPRCKTNLYYKSFFVSGIIAWNKLNSATKMAISKQSFKRQVCLRGKTESTVHLFPHNTSRDNQVLFAQLRSNFSDLKGHLFSKGCVSESACHCGYHYEDTEHYLLHCNTFSKERQELFQKKFKSDKWTHLHCLHVSLLTNL